MDLAQLFQDQEKLKALQGKIGPGASLSEVKPYLKDIKGIKIDGPTVGVGSSKASRVVGSYVKPEQSAPLSSRSRCVRRPGPASW